MSGRGMPVSASMALRLEIVWRAQVAKEFEGLGEHAHLLGLDGVTLLGEAHQDFRWSCLSSFATQKSPTNLKTSL